MKRQYVVNSSLDYKASRAKKIILGKRQLSYGLILPRISSQLNLKESSRNLSFVEENRKIKDKLNKYSRQDIINNTSLDTFEEDMEKKLKNIMIITIFIIK